MIYFFGTDIARLDSFPRNLMIDHLKLFVKAALSMPSTSVRGAPRGVRHHLKASRHHRVGVRGSYSISR